MADETYDAQRIRQLAVDFGDGYSLAPVVLQRGETAWNPASTKGPLFGPSLIEYRFTPSNIEVFKEDFTVECMGGDRLEEWPYWRACQSDREAGTTLCLEHALARHASVS